MTIIATDQKHIGMNYNNFLKPYTSQVQCAFIEFGDCAFIEFGDCE